MPRPLHSRGRDVFLVALLLALVAALLELPSLAWLFLGGVALVLLLLVLATSLLATRERRGTGSEATPRLPPA